MAANPPNNPNPNANKQQEDSLKRIQALLDQISKSYSTLGEKSPFAREAQKVVKGFEDADKAVDALEDSLKSVNDRIRESKSSAGDLLQTLQGIVKEINPKAINYTKDFEGGFKKIVNEAKKLQYEEEGINKLSKKELEQLQQKIKQGEKDAKFAAERLLQEKGITKDVDQRTRAYKSLTDDEKAAIAFLNDENSIVGTINDKIKRKIALEEESNKVLGVAGATIDGIEGALSKLGFSKLSSLLGADEAKNKMKSLADQIAKDRQREIDLENEISDIQRKRPKNEKEKKEKEDRLRALKEEKNTLSSQNKEFEGMKGKMAVLTEGAKSMGASLKNALKDPTLLITAFGNELISALTKADKETGELAKSFGTSYASAASLRNELNSIANFSADVNINTGALQKSLLALNKEFGTSTMMSGELLKDFTRMTTVAGYTNEAAAGLSKITVATGTDLSKNTEAILGEAAALNAVNGLALNEKQILEEVAKASAATTLTLGMQPKELAKAVFEAKALGASLQDVENISQQLLQFETSIGNELEAELLTGKQLNLETARLAALNGDLATVAKEVKKQIGDSANFSKMNVIQQEALAKSVGMTREQLAKSLLEQDALQKIGAKDAAQAKEKYDRLVRIYGVEEASKRLGDQKYAQQLASQSVQERFNATVEKLREVFVSIAEPILQIVSPIMDLATTILPLINVVLTPITGAFKFIGESVQFFVGGIKEAFNILTGFLSPLKGIFDFFGKIVKTISPLISILKFVTGALVTMLAIDKARLAINTLLNKEKVIGLATSAREAILNKKSLIPKIGEAAMTAYKNLAAIPIVGIPLAIAAAASAAALGYKFITGNDVVSGGYGKRTLMAPEGAIALNDKDTVIAGTDLGGKNKSKKDETSIPSQSTPSIDLSPLIERMSAVEGVLKQILVKETNIYMDSTKVGTGFAMGTSKVQ